MNAAGASAPTSDVVVNVGCTAVPAAPAAFTTTVSGNVVTLLLGRRARHGADGARGRATRRATTVLTFPFAAPAAGIAVSAPPATYYVRARAVNSCGQSAPSVERTVVVPQ